MGSWSCACGHVWALKRADLGTKLWQPDPDLSVSGDRKGPKNVCVISFMEGEGIPNVMHYQEHGQITFSTWLKWCPVRYGHILVSREREMEKGSYPLGDRSRQRFLIIIHMTLKRRRPWLSCREGRAASVLNMCPETCWSSSPPITWCLAGHNVSLWSMYGI